MAHFYRKVFTLFALLLFAVQSLAGSHLLCKMNFTYSSSVAMPASPVKPANCHSQMPNAKNSKMLDAKNYFNVNNNQHSPNSQPPKVNAHLNDCFYCTHKLCNTSLTTAGFAFSLPALLNLRFTLKPTQYAEPVNSGKASIPFRPPILG